MPKASRKRKFENDGLRNEMVAPKSKFKPHEAEEEDLSRILLGGPSSFLESLEEAEKESGQNVGTPDSGLGDENSDGEIQERKPVWTDEEDDGIDTGNALDMQKRILPDGGVNKRSNKYKKLLKNKFNSSYGTPKWAKLNNKHSEEDEDILHTVGLLKNRADCSLPSGNIEFKKVKDLNCETYNEGPNIYSVEFNPSSSVALVTGHAGIASLYAVDGKNNNKLHSVGFQKFPIFCARFVHNGHEAVLGSWHRHMYSYDLLTAKTMKIPLSCDMKKFVVSPDDQIIAVAGNYGEIHILTSQSKEKIATLKQDYDITALEFSSDSKLLFGHSNAGEVTVWDMNTRRVRHKWTDDGCISGTQLAISPSNQFLATSSAEGVVNTYDLDDVLKEKLPKPKKSLFNLTTKINQLKFNSTSEILAFSSSELKNSIKLYHLGSQTVFSNFPNFNTKFGNINVVNFSPNSGYVAFGNKKSTVALYRLKHYKNY